MAAVDFILNVMKFSPERRPTISTASGSLADGEYTAFDYRGGVVTIKDIGLTTPAQTRTLVWGALGATIDDTAGKVLKSTGTVRGHRNASFAALQARNMEHSVNRCFELGLFTVRFDISLPNAHYVSQHSGLIACKAEGLNHAETGEVLGLTERTAKQYASNILGNLEVPNMAAAILLCRMGGILPAGPARDIGHDTADFPVAA